MILAPAARFSSRASELRRDHRRGDLADGLAKALGVSYFSLRRLLAPYDVALPAARSRR